MGPRCAGLIVALAAGVVLSMSGCSDTPAAPSPFPNAGSTPAPTEPLKTLFITGPNTFSAIGQTGQLTASGVLADGTIRDITPSVQWRSSDVTVARVSPAGILTVIGFGTSDIETSYASLLSRPYRIAAWPAGTFAVTGRVREPGLGAIAFATVRDPRSGMSTETDPQGRFRLDGVAPGPLVIEKAGYEPVEVEARPNDLDVPMQRVLRLPAGSSLTPSELAPNDMVYLVEGDRCFPCRLIRVTAPAGTLRLQLTWTPPTTAVHVWARGQRMSGSPGEVTGEVSVSGGEVLVYVGRLMPPGTTTFQDYVAFTLSASMR